jgi:hypothetical protein
MKKNLLPFSLGMIAGALAISLFPLATLLIAALVLVAAYFLVSFILNHLMATFIICGILAAIYFLI